MPAPPEFRRALRRERLVEVLRECHAKQFSAADDNIDTSGKLKVQLDRISDRGEYDKTSVIIFIVSEQMRCEVTESVRYDHLLEQTPDDPEETFIEISHIQRLSGKQRVRSVGISGDGAFHDLGEETQKQGQFAQMLLSGISLPVYVGNVAYRLQRVE